MNSCYKLPFFPENSSEMFMPIYQTAQGHTPDVSDIITGINLMPHGGINYSEIRRKFLSIV
jgi:hypothetical protein